MRRLIHIGLFILVFGAWPGFAFADPPAGAFDRSNAAGNQIVLRATSADVAAIADQHGLSVVVEAATAEGNLAVIEGPSMMTADQIADLLQGDPRIDGHEPAVLAALPGVAEPVSLPFAGDAVADLAKTDVFSSPCLSQGSAGPEWSGYADQEAGRLVGLGAAQDASADCGAATVAIIDTGIDADHPALAGAFVPGYDFLNEREGLPSEWDLLDQSVSPIIEQSVSPIIESKLISLASPARDALLAGQGEVVMVDTSTGILLHPNAVLNLAGYELPALFGHGTMVAGIVRLTAPAASIMPLRVFDGAGSGHVFDVVRAIYFAVDHGADVISMSFSISEPSQELHRAVQYARSHGVVCVAAAGNQSEQTQVYPAAYSDSVGVASTTLDDELSDFSNYGSALVKLAAPGSAIVSTYPGGHFAVSWGTSFSTPFVAGTIALIRARYPGGDTPAFHHMVQDLTQGSESISGLGGDIGSGRLDVLATVLQAGD